MVLTNKVVVSDNGSKNWYINDEKLTESEFLAQQSCTDKTVVIDGKAYKLVAI